jgi:hypothetical protein
MSGVAGGLARHMSHNPPERMTVALDRNRNARFRVADRLNGAITLVHSRLVVPQHIGYRAIGWDRHATFPVSVECGADKVIAEPIPLSLSQVLDETNDGGTAADERAPQLLIG